MQGFRIQNEEQCKDHDRMRRDLRYHFMNPKQKWKAKGTLPIKMILIVIKLVCVTVQIVLFSENNSNEVAFYEGSKITFKHLFLHNWQSSFETLPYPPNQGPFAIYRVEEFYSAANYAMENYYKLENHAIGPYGFGENNIPIMTLCIVYYRYGEIFPFNHTYKFSKEIWTNCTEIQPIINGTVQIYDVKTYLERTNFNIDFNKLLKADIKFALRSIQLKSYEMDESPDCLEFDITILFDNSNNNGQMGLSLNAEMISFNCVRESQTLLEWTMIDNVLWTLDVVALVLSFISLILCSRSIIRLHKFWKKTLKFFQNELHTDVSDKWKYFFSISYLIIFVGDILVICGTILKMDMHTILKKDIERFILCNYFLGFGLFLGHLTLVRYFSYFPKSSILVNTIRVAMPPLIRFSLCSSLLYIAFAILGWIILGPYHLKFRTLDSSIACLFSLMLGDDMYVTLSVINHKNTTIYIFSQLFVYLFCVLFIFVVLNLILTIIYEAYEEAEKQDLMGAPSDVFWDFVNSCPEALNSNMYKTDLKNDITQMRKRNRYLVQKCVDIMCCCVGKTNHTLEIKSEADIKDEDPEVDTNNSEYSANLSQSFPIFPSQSIMENNEYTNYGSIPINKTRHRNSVIQSLEVEQSRNRIYSM